MFNIVSLLVGVATLAMAMVAFVPFFGWANWMIIPVAAAGAAIGMLSDRTAGRNLNLLVVGLGSLRLLLGGGLF